MYPYPKIKKPSFTFADFFAGIGGFHLAAHNLNGRCVFHCEKDKFARQTYEANFGPGRYHDDIKTLDPYLVPDHDILFAGFPCPAFSKNSQGTNNKLGNGNGFDHKTGDLFFYLLETIKIKKPGMILLENVKNLKYHNKGESLRIIRERLDRAGYEMHIAVINADGYVPQRRERIFFVGFSRDMYHDTPFTFPVPPEAVIPLHDVLEPHVDDKYTVTDIRIAGMEVHRQRHLIKGNRYNYTIVEEGEVSPTLLANYAKQSKSILIPQGKGRNPRRLTPRECARVQGFPENFLIPVSDTQAYKQFGNSVATPHVQDILKSMIKFY